MISNFKLAIPSINCYTKLCGTRHIKHIWINKMSNKYEMNDEKCMKQKNTNESSQGVEEN